jgi:hypothetical protein
MIWGLEDVKPFLSDSSYVGLCPKLSEVGDGIYIPLGAHVPYILRKLDDGVHLLVGEAYVHGIMDGEIFEGKENIPREILRLVLYSNLISAFLSAYGKSWKKLLQFCTLTSTTVITTDSTHGFVLSIVTI